jgi:vancomycin resistance protein YoaR
MMVGRSGPAWQRPGALWQAFFFTVDEPFKVTLDSDKAKAVLQSFAKDLYTPPQNAQLVVNDTYQVKISDGKPGKVLDLDASVKELAQDIYPFDEVIELRPVDQQPEVTTQDVLGMKVSGLMASYTTYFDTSNVNRTYNVNVAADALDNSLVKPGDVFSFNQVVGPRSQETGYKEAMVIEQNKFTPGIGGGVCQVSSTLYNSVLLAGLKIVERSNHSLPVTYVPLGRDATVAYGLFDLRFRNNTSGYLYIKARAAGGELTIAILGNTAEKKNVVLETDVDKVLDFKVITKNDPTLYQGKTLVETEGVKGYEVRAYRTVNGVKTLLSDDIYVPVDEIVHVGTMPVPETPPPPGNQQLVA